MEVVTSESVGAPEFPLESELEVELVSPASTTVGSSELDDEVDTERLLKILVMLSLLSVAAGEGCVAGVLPSEEAGVFALLLAFPLGSALLCSLLPDLLVTFEVEEESCVFPATCDNAAEKPPVVGAAFAAGFTGGVLTAILGMLTITSAPQARRENARGGPDGSD